jgi:hypothetical protein
MNAWEAGELSADIHLGSLKYSVIADRDVLKTREWWLRLIPFYGKSIIINRDLMALKAKQHIENEELRESPR